MNACKSSGYRPTRDELRVWVKNPGRRSRDPLASAVDMVRQIEQSAFGPPEHLDVSLTRLRWLVSTGGELLQVTPLGRALLHHAETATEPTEQSVEIFINRDDPLAYPQIIGTIAGGSAPDCSSMPTWAWNSFMTAGPTPPCGAT